jgi:hypothetical protein
MEDWGDVCACMDTVVRMFKHELPEDVDRLRAVRRRLTQQVGVNESGTEESR